MAELDEVGVGINWLVSYPKSGNTWMRMLLANYFGETDTPHDINAPGITNGIASLRWHFDEILGVPSSDLTCEESMLLRHHVYRYIAARKAKPVWMKAHDAQTRQGDGEWLFPKEASRAAIYLIRNPLDVAVSYAFHSAISVATTVEWLCDPAHEMGRNSLNQLTQFLGTWSDHVLGWIDQTTIPVLVIRYEDMLADPAGQLTRVIAFGRPDLVVDSARVALAVELSRFENLQLAEAQHGFREKYRKSERFFRSGRADDWRNHLTAEQTLRLCAKHRVVMARFGYNSDVAHRRDLP